MDNLWNLKDINKKVDSSPNLILEEQAKYFEKAVKDVLYAKIINTKLKNNDGIQEYKLATSFNIVSPTLDNYTYTLFTVYSNPESNYPLSISVNNNEEYTDFDYTCNVKRQIIAN